MPLEKAPEHAPNTLFSIVSFKKLSPSDKAFLSHLSHLEILKAVQEALRNENLRNAMSEEMRALEKNQTWEVVKLPLGKRPVGFKWVFIVKYKSDGTLERYKAKLVAKGYS